MKYFTKNFGLKTKFVPINNYRKPLIKREIKQLIKAKAEYFQLMKLDIITVTESSNFKNKVKKNQ